MALSYFSVGNDAAEASRALLLDYYAYLGDWAQGIAEATPRTPDDIRTAARRFEDAGVDELVFDPTVADLAQVDRLADIAL